MNIYLVQIANMRIPKEDRLGEPPKLRGYGYVEFEDRESLMSALIIPDTVSFAFLQVKMLNLWEFFSI